MVIEEAIISPFPANNQGIRSSSGEFILLLNSDAFLNLSAVTILLDYMKNHPDTAICGPQLLYENQSWQRCYGSFPSPRTSFLDAVGLTFLLHFGRRISWDLFKKSLKPDTVDYVDGACMLIRKQLIREIGDLDEGFFFFCEDVEFCLRAHRAGWKIVYIPTSQVVHLRGGSSSKEGLERVAKFKYHSIRKLVLAEYGQKGWKRYRFWAIQNFRFRYYFTNFGEKIGLHIGIKTLAYKITLSVFAKEDDER